MLSAEQLSRLLRAVFSLKSRLFPAASQSLIQIEALGQAYQRDSRRVQLLQSILLRDICEETTGHVPAKIPRYGG